MKKKFNLSKALRDFIKSDDMVINIGFNHEGKKMKEESVRSTAYSLKLVCKKDWDKELFVITKKEETNEGAK